MRKLLFFLFITLSLPTAFGGPGGIAFAATRIGAATLEAYVLLSGGLAKELSIEVPGDRPALIDNPQGSNVVVLLTDIDLDLRGLRRIGEAGLEGLAQIGRTRRTLAIAISVAAPLPAQSDSHERRDLREGQINIDAETSAADIVAVAASQILNHEEHEEHEDNI